MAKPTKPCLADEIEIAKQALADNRVATAEFIQATKELREALKERRRLRLEK